MADQGAGKAMGNDNFLPSADLDCSVETSNLLKEDCPNLWNHFFGQLKCCKPVVLPMRSAESPNR
jgi:hypothetical protein